MPKRSEFGRGMGDKNSGKIPERGEADEGRTAVLHEL